MKPTEPPTAIEGQRIDYGPPEGVPEEECDHLITVVGELSGGAWDGIRTLTSYWKPSKEELDYLIENDGFVELMLIGTTHPPVALNVVNKDGK